MKLKSLQQHAFDRVAGRAQGEAVVVQTAGIARQGFRLVGRMRAISVSGSICALESTHGHGRTPDGTSFAAHQHRHPARHRHLVGPHGGAVLGRHLHPDDVLAHLQVHVVVVRTHVGVVEHIAVAVEVLDRGVLLVRGRAHRDPPDGVRHRRGVGDRIRVEEPAQRDGGGVIVGKPQGAQRRVGGGERQRQLDRGGGGPAEAAVGPDVVVVDIPGVARVAEGEVRIAHMQTQTLGVGARELAGQTEEQTPVLRTEDNAVNRVAVRADIERRVGQATDSTGREVSVNAGQGFPHRQGPAPDPGPARKVRGRAGVCRARHRHLVGPHGVAVLGRHLHPDDVLAHLQVHVVVVRTHVGVVEHIAVAVEVLDGGVGVARRRPHRDPPRARVRHRRRVHGVVRVEGLVQRNGGAVARQRQTAQRRVGGGGRQRQLDRGGGGPAEAAVGQT